MKKVDYGNGIQAFVGAFPQSFCDDIISQFTREPNKELEKLENNGQLGNYREADTVYSSRLETWKQTNEQIQGILKPFIAGYVGEFLITTDPFNDTGFEIVHYKPGRQCHPHRDAGPYQVSLFGSFIINLNTLDTGGELEFLEQKIKIPALAGQLVIFPAAYPYPHRVNPSVQDRYALVSFLKYAKWNA